MPIKHKFENFYWDNGFYTQNSILHTPYKPEVIFIGTFNHGWAWNTADFFYGRDMYMWPILANIFLYNENILTKPRNENNRFPILSEIFNICKLGKITFADIVKGTKENILIQEHNGFVQVNKEVIWKNYSDKMLNTLGTKNYLDDNVSNIIEYINNNPSIKNIYFTFNSENWLLKKRLEIITGTPNLISGSIFTPTGMGFRRNLPGYMNRSFSIAHSWIWNIPGQKKYNNRYRNLDHSWLLEKGVDIYRF